MKCKFLSANPNRWGAMIKENRKQPNPGFNSDRLDVETYIFKYLIHDSVPECIPVYRKHFEMLRKSEKCSQYWTDGNGTEYAYISKFGRGDAPYNLSAKITPFDEQP